MKLDARLQAAADAAGRCALFADIGSDHAKLALYLLETGAAARAVCADIHAAPLARGQQAAAGPAALRADGRRRAQSAGR